MRVLPIVVWVACMLAGSPSATARDLPPFAPTPAALAAGYARADRPDSAPVFKARIEPHWLADGRFWYRNDLRGGAKEFVLVDGPAGSRRPAFDHRRLAEALRTASTVPLAAERLPFDTIAFADGGREVRFRVGDTPWACRLTDYVCTRRPAADDTRPPEPVPDRGGRRRRRPSADGPAHRSPDGKWTVDIRDGNLFARATGGKEKQLTTDGRPGHGYDLPFWSPDSKTLAAFRVEPGEHKEVFRVVSSPKGGGRAVLQHNPYPLPGDRLDRFTLHLFDPATGTAVRPDVAPIDLDWPAVRWAADGRTLTYPKTDRGHQRFRLVEVEAGTGKARNLIDERADTFLWTAHAEDAGVPPVTWFKKGNTLLYASEKSGWRHLYLVDAAAGREVNPVTRGEWVVRGIDRIDEEKRQLWFSAGGFHPGQDPYFVHHFRVNLDGTGLVALTAGDGTHSVQFSPDGAYLIDTYSRADRPPVHELRRTADGSLVCKLDDADAPDGPPGPEVFVAKGRDGATDIWGVIHRPAGFDPAKKYPVVEDIYAGPQGAFVPKAYSPGRPYRHLTELGFVVVQMDGMGTALRSKAFHDVCWHNLKDGGFPDRIRWHRAAAARYPWYDADRVGVFGTSAGGQNAAGAVLFHGDFYRAAVAACGCHDNRMDKASWNEQWMGFPVGPHYAACSNVENAHRLRGKLQLVVGELDDNVPPESTYRLCDALNKAGKSYEFVLVPGMGHSDGGAYGRRRMQDFFVRHLHGTEPPDRNARPGPVPATLRAALKLAPFYQKHLDAAGLPVVGSAKVSDDALAEAAWIVGHMLDGRDDILKAMAGQKVRAVVMAADEYTTDVPEHADLRPKVYWDRRARGLGATPHAPAVSGGEENLLNFRHDPYPDENIFLHEFAHAVHETGLNVIDPTFDGRLKAAFESARDRGLWKNTYAATDRKEYWAEGVQSWFDDNAPADALHNGVRTRAALKAHDPALAELCREVFGDRPWRYVRPRDRGPAERAHLPGYDPAAVPEFHWRQTPVGDRPRVSVQTETGDFEIELDARAAPAAVASLLRVALDGGFHSGRVAGAAGGEIRAALNPRWRERSGTATAWERVPTTTDAPAEGAVWLVGDAAGWTGFVVYTAATNDTPTGKAVRVGRVVKGLDVVRGIGTTGPGGDRAAAGNVRRVIRNE